MAVERCRMPVPPIIVAINLEGRLVTAQMGRLPATGHIE